MKLNVLYKHNSQSYPQLCTYLGITVDIQKLLTHKDGIIVFLNILRLHVVKQLARTSSN